MISILFICLFLLSGFSRDIWGAAQGELLHQRSAVCRSRCPAMRAHISLGWEPFPSWPSPYHPFQQGLSLHAPSIPSCLPAWHLHSVSQFPNPTFPNLPQSVPFLCLQKENRTYFQNPDPLGTLCAHTPAVLALWCAGAFLSPTTQQVTSSLSTYSIVSITRTSKEIEKARRKRMSRQKVF